MARDGVRNRRVPDGRAPSRLDPLAPDWLVRVLAPRRAPVPWADMVRVAATLVAPLAVGVLVGQPGLGVYGSMGALAGALADRGGARGERMARVVSGVVFGAVGIAVGRAATGTGVVPVVVVALAAVLAALLSAQSATLSFGGLQLLVSVGIAGGLPGTLPTVDVVAGFLVGGALAFLTSWLQSLLQHTGDVDHDAVVAVVRALARLLREPGGRTGEPGGTGLVVSNRRALTEALDAAHDRLARARAVSPGRRDDLRALSAVLTATSPLVSACVAYARTGRGDSELADLVDRLAGVVAAGGRGWRIPDEQPATGGAPAGTTATRSLLHDAVLAGVARVADALTDAPGGGAAGGRPGRRGGGGRLILGRSAWTFVARLTLTMIAAEIVRQVVPVERSYWIVLTAALVLKPDFGSVFARGVQRTLGTLVGVVVGAAVLAVVPSGSWTLLPIAVFAAFAPFGIARNYGLFSTFLTPVVLLLIDFGRPVGADVALDRLLDTVLGAGVVLVVGYLCWPSTWRPRLGAKVGSAVAGLAAYARAAFGPDRAAAGAARRAAYRSLSDLRAALQSTLSEPPPVSTRAAAWWPFVVQLERAVDALTNAMVLARAAAHHAPADGDVAMLTTALDDLGAAVREQRPPRPLPLPSDPTLAGVVADLDGARRLLTAPDA